LSLVWGTLLLTFAAADQVDALAEAFADCQGSPISMLSSLGSGHRHEDDSLISELKELLSKAGCEVRDSSINADNPNQANDEGYIKSILAERMQWAGKILVIISPQTKYHEWVGPVSRGSAERPA